MSALAGEVPSVSATTADGDTAVTFLGGCAAGLRRDVVVVPPLGSAPLTKPRWARALAVVEIGSVELETLTGRRARLDEGSIFTLGLTGPVTVHNVGNGSSALCLVFPSRYAGEQPDNPTPRRPRCA